MRFLEFEGEWVECKLLDIAQKITIKNKDRRVENVISNSAQRGLIPQLDFFDKEIANNDNTSGYYIIENGDYVYNPRKSVTAPYGPVNIYKGDHLGIVSPLYLCFKVKNINKDFLFHFFKSSSWHKFIYLNGDNGARHDRVSIKDETFFKLPVCYPKTEEQNKIVEFLSLIDQRIETQNKIIEQLESLIRGLNNHLHEQYANDIEISLAELGEFYNGLSGKSGDDFGSGKPYITYVNVYQNNIIDESMIGYVKISNEEKQNTINYGDVLFTISSETPKEVGISSIYLGRSQGLYLNSFCFGYRLNDFTILSPQYMAYCFSSYQFRKLVYPLAQGSTRFNLHMSHFANQKFKIPTVQNQLKIQKLLDSTSEKLQVEKLIHVSLKEQKSFFLKKLFI